MIETSMYWIASYPRSGNTFLRILLKEVYGIHTWEGYGKELPSLVFETLERKGGIKYTFIKTHDLPERTEIPHSKLKAIYLYRDGRDSAVSAAHHRSNIIKPGSDYLFNLRAIILAPFRISWGSWSQHTSAWSDIAIHKIKFEDLIQDPVSELKKLEEVIDLPKGDYSKIPTFKDLKKNRYDYGSGHKGLTEKQQKQRRKKFFRAGKINTWKDEMPRVLQDIFHLKNRHQLQKMGYDCPKPIFLVYLKMIGQYFLLFMGYLKENFTRK